MTWIRTCVLANISLCGDVAQMVERPLSNHKLKCGRYWDRCPTSPCVMPGLHISTRYILRFACVTACRAEDPASAVCVTRVKGNRRCKGHCNASPHCVKEHLIYTKLPTYSQNSHQELLAVLHGMYCSMHCALMVVLLSAALL